MILASNMSFKEPQRINQIPSVKNKCKKCTHIHIYFQSMLPCSDFEGGKMSNPFVNFKNIGYILPKWLRKTEKSNLYKQFYKKMT